MPLVVVEFLVVRGQTLLLPTVDPTMFITNDGFTSTVLGVDNAWYYSNTTTPVRILVVRVEAMALDASVLLELARLVQGA